MAPRALLTGHHSCHRGASNAGAGGQINDLGLPRVSGAATVAALRACRANGHTSQAGLLVSVGIFGIVSMKGPTL